MTDNNGLHSVRIDGVTRIGHARLTELRKFIEDDLGLRVWWSNAGDNSLLVMNGDETVAEEKLTVIREYQFTTTPVLSPATAPTLDVAARGAMATHAHSSQGV